VAPLTVAKNVTDCDTMTTVLAGTIETVTTLVVLPPPPQPASVKNAAALRLNKSEE